MKTLEELEQMTVDQLKGIATGLGADPKANIRKPELVQMVYDIQQPDAPDAEDNTPAEPEVSKEVTTGDDVEAKLEEIATFFGGELIEDGEADNGATIFSVVNEDADEITRGTFLELYDAIHAGDADLTVDEPADPNDHTPAVEEIDTTIPDVENEEALTEIERALNALRSYGLKYSIDGSTVRLQAGSKVQTTTLNQPAHRVVATAEQLCNYK